MAKRLFVGGLPYDVTQSQLEEMFAEVGKVDSADLIIDKFSGRSKGFGFVEMGSEDDAKKAIDSLNGKEMSGRNIAVNEAKPREDRPSGGNRGGFDDRGSRQRY